MPTATTNEILDQLGVLISLEHMGEKLLERASRAPEDPRESAYLWQLATEYRDHARILRRHRRSLDRHVAEVEYPRWPRGRGPSPKESLESAAETTRQLAGEYRSTVSLHDDPYLKKFLAILAEEHDRCALMLEFLSDGKFIFPELEEETITDQ